MAGEGGGEGKEEKRIQRHNNNQINSEQCKINARKMNYYFKFQICVLGCYGCTVANGIQWYGQQRAHFRVYIDA